MQSDARNNVYMFKVNPKAILALFLYINNQLHKPR